MLAITFSSVCPSLDFKDLRGDARYLQGEEGTMDSNLGAYLVCGVLITFYAWDRFSTPASNRSSTRQALYWWGCAGYIVSALDDRFHETTQLHL